MAEDIAQTLVPQTEGPGSFAAVQEDPGPAVILTDNDFAYDDSGYGDPAFDGQIYDDPAYDDQTYGEYLVISDEEADPSEDGEDRLPEEAGPDGSSAAAPGEMPDDLSAAVPEEVPDGLFEEVPEEELSGEDISEEELSESELLELYAAAAGGSVYAGECGKTSADKVYWMLDSTGETLSIFGRGAMKDLSLEEWTASRLASPGDGAAAPWLMAAVRFGIKHIKIDSGVTSVGSNCFRSLVNVTDISIADTVKVIGEAAFRSITALTGLVLPDSVTELGNGVCYGCSALADLTLSANLTSLPEQAFMNCSALNAVTLPAKIENLNTQTFCQCVKLKEVRCLGRDVDVLGPGC